MGATAVVAYSMATKSLDKLREAETHIRWDETDEPAVLWTATPSVRREWEAHGFKVTGTKDNWRCEVPKNRISYRVLAKMGQNP
jgi:hypothetical protein